MYLPENGVPGARVSRKKGLYDERNEHDSCGVFADIDISGKKSHQTIENALAALCRLDQRGARGADPLLGDGVGLIMQTPDALLRDWAEKTGYDLPPLGQYGVAMSFLPQDEAAQKIAVKQLEKTAKANGLTVVGWRDVPTDTNIGLGKPVLESMPVIRQAILKPDENNANLNADQNAFEARLLATRNRIQREIKELAAEEEKAMPKAKRTASKLRQVYFPSFSSRTVVYKGLLLADQLRDFYGDLRNDLTVSAFALSHQRFSTNTFPSWALAHPYRFVVHNGEINTIRGNGNWMNARLRALRESATDPFLKEMLADIDTAQSDTAVLDNILEIMVVAAGYPLAEAMMMLVPPAWQNDKLMPKKIKEFFKYKAKGMEPLDGPALLGFTDGRQVGATLDRNGLRPARYIETVDGHLIFASEAGVLQIPEEQIRHKWRLQPGKILLVDLQEGCIISDDDLKETFADQYDYESLDAEVKLENLPAPAAAATAPAVDNARRALFEQLRMFGITKDTVQYFLEPMMQTGSEDPVGSMGNDTPLAVLSTKAKRLYAYFKQAFAQVTNPPIDPIREALVMSLFTYLGKRLNILNREPQKHHVLALKEPVITDEDMAKIKALDGTSENGLKTVTLDITWPLEQGPDGLARALKKLNRAAEKAVREGANIIVLSDREAKGARVRDDADITVPSGGEASEESDREPEARVPIPALLATSAVHHHLIDQGLRTETGVAVETGDAAEVQDFCALAAYGAEAVNPYLTFRALEQIRLDRNMELSAHDVQYNYLKAVAKGIYKVMSKMGISTFQSYCGAQIYDAIGLNRKFINRYFYGTTSQFSGAATKQIAEEALKRHEQAFSGDDIDLDDDLVTEGEFFNRHGGEAHVWNNETIGALQHAARLNSNAEYNRYTKLIYDQDEKQPHNIRGLLQFRKRKPLSRRKSITLDEVESWEKIAKRFSTGAMSFGSISKEAHETLAIAMNRIGGKSNTGEGGEEAERYKPLPNGDSKRSAIKQVASGRFGVTAEYLANADMIQIKMAQGAKPGEGGQLPGSKVDKWIAKVRFSVPGVGLISPPPHHDIYSIEDLKLLIEALRKVNPDAKISVKLVAEVGVGTVAAGVAKAGADHVTIAGAESAGGTGAASYTSIKAAGGPGEAGLAETQQTLVRNGLRDRIAVQVDGSLRTGRDVVKMALLGADEFGFATMPLIAAGCVLLRNCHLNTCERGVATQDPVLRKLFSGEPEHIVNVFRFIAEEVREIMAELGYRTFDEMIGQVQDLERLPKAKINAWKAMGISLSRLLYKEKAAPGDDIYNSKRQDHSADTQSLDNTVLIPKIDAVLQSGALKTGTKVVMDDVEIRNTDRVVGATLSGKIAKKYGHAGLDDETIHVNFKGTAGGDFGAWLAHGVTFNLVGEANDHVGEGLSGGRIIVRQPGWVEREADKNIIAGNVVLYGAISGEAFFNGVAGERFAVRNSGAVAVVEGVGDHGCEYMTGGAVMVIGEVGRNFGAGMSGGVAYVWNPEGHLKDLFNSDTVTLDKVERTEYHDEEIRDYDMPSKKWVAVNDNGLGDLRRFHEERIHAMLERHYELTGSARAHQLLHNWEQTLSEFTVVTPKGYSNALTEMRNDAELRLAA